MNNNQFENNAMSLDDLENQTKRQSEELKAMIRNEYHRQMVSLAKMRGFDPDPNPYEFINVPFANGRA